jgi:hypothetical protein
MNSCLKGNFKGRRYKCLICYDYDLCSTCYESGATTSRHTADHPMQCILTRNDFGNISSIIKCGEVFTRKCKNQYHYYLVFKLSSYRHVWEFDFFTCPVGQPVIQDLLVSFHWYRTIRKMLMLRPDIVKCVGRNEKWSDKIGSHWIQIPKRAGTTGKSISTGIQYWVCFIKEPCLISDLSITYFD